MKKIICILGTLLYCSINHAQHPQLRLKLGAVKTFASPFVSEGFAYKNTSLHSPYPIIGLEFSKPIVSHNRSWFLGFSQDIQGFAQTPNLKNFQIFRSSGTSQLVIGTWKLYGGIEQRLGKKEMPINKNYLTVMGAIGLTINPFGGNGERAFGSGGEEGITKDGKYFRSPYGNYFFGSDYYSVVYVRRTNLISPTLIAGLRWHIRNRKGDEALTVELLANYGLTRYYNYYIPYTLDNIPQTDKLGEKGVNVQLNILIPLRNFGKKKKDHRHKN